MEKEVSSGLNLGMVLLAVALIVVLAFGVFQIAKGLANDGVNNVQESIAQVQASQFSDYDQKIVTGTQLMSAMANFKGKDITVVVLTNNVRKGIGTLKSDTTAYPVTLVGGAERKGAIQYNAILGEEGKTVDNPVKATTTGNNASNLQGNVELTLENGYYITSDAIGTDNTGKKAFNMKMKYMSESGNPEFIATISRFNANLIKDSTGTTVGVVFEQIEN